MRTPGLTGAVLGVAAVFGISWITAIAYWRLGTRVPGPAEIAGLMLGMPATLGGVLTWWRRREPAAPAGPVPVADVATDGPEASPAWLAVRAAAFELPPGNAPAEVLAHLADGTGLGLHPRLRDPRGFGVLAAEVDGVDTATIDAELAALDPAAMPARPELARALSLADLVLERLLSACDALPTACGLLLPAHWPGAERELARVWIEQRLAAAAPEAAPTTTAFAVASGGELLRTLRTPPASADEVATGSTLWLALASNIGAGSVDRWARSGMLLDAGNPNGRAPGEAAAGVVLDASNEEDACALVHLPDPGTAPAGASGDDIATAMGEAMSASGIDPSGIGLLVSDMDHHPSQGAKLVKAASAHLPQIDPALAVLRLGQSCGHADAALALAAIALCAHAATDSGLSSLAVGSEDNLGVAVALVRPRAPNP